MHGYVHSLQYLHNDVVLCVRYLFPILKLIGSNSKIYKVQKKNKYTNLYFLSLDLPK